MTSNLNQISIIIPTYNEAGTVDKLISYLLANGTTHLLEIIVADGKSTDNTAALAKAAGAKVIRCTHKGRAAQMNTGAQQAKGSILYFLHADSYPPSDYCKDIVKAVEEGYASGCFRLAFDHSHWFLKLNCWFTRFDIDLIRFGDQSLFVTKEKFKEVGGFKEELMIMEDQEIINRLKKIARFKVMRKAVTTSARKYIENGVYRLQGIFFIIFMLYKLGFSQSYLLKTYKKLIRQNKL